MKDLQNQCHRFVENFMEKKQQRQTYQEATNIWFFTILTEKFKKIETLENELKILKNKLKL